MELYNKLKEVLESLEVDATKFYEKGNKTAGRRLRKGMQEIKTLAQDLRKDVQDTNKSRD